MVITNSWYKRLGVRHLKDHHTASTRDTALCTLAAAPLQFPTGTAYNSPFPALYPRRIPLVVTTRITLCS